MTEIEHGDEVLVDAPLVPDPDAAVELGPGDPETISDEDAQGSRLLIVRREASGKVLASGTYGVVKIACTFQPAPGARFTWARVTLRLESPAGVRVLDVAPRGVPEDEPVKIILTEQGRLGIRALSGEARHEGGTRKEFVVYHCPVHGSGESTPLARWDFKENPHRRDGLDGDHELLLTLPVVGQVRGTLSARAHLVRPGLAGGVERFRDLVLRRSPRERRHPVSFDITMDPGARDDARYLHQD